MGIIYSKALFYTGCVIVPTILIVEFLFIFSKVVPLSIQFIFILVIAPLASLFLYNYFNKRIKKKEEKEKQID